MKIIDTCGQTCPAPLIATRKALREADEGEPFALKTDSHTSFNNIVRYLKDNKIGFSFSEASGIWTLTVSNSGEGGELTNPDEYCTIDIPHFSKGSFVIAVSSNLMGTGDNDLGSRLMTNFIKAVKDLDTLPSKILFYNSGVLLGRRDSETATILQELEKMGVNLYFCATCLDHFGISEEVTVGVKSNMFEIVQAMASASNIIRP